jgi:hypothetical protein
MRRQSALPRAGGAVRAGTLRLCEVKAGAQIVLSLSNSNWLITDPLLLSTASAMPQIRTLFGRFSDAALLNLPRLKHSDNSV